MKVPMSNYEQGHNYTQIVSETFIFIPIIIEVTVKWEGINLNSEQEKGLLVKEALKYIGILWSIQKCDSSDQLSPLPV